MTIEQRIRIANSFSCKFEEFQLHIKLPAQEFSIFEEGVFAKSMDEKWNIFIVENYLYWARSWTNKCIYKIQFFHEGDSIRLIRGFVTKNKQEYNSDDIDKDRILFLELLQTYLERDDLYIDPAYHYEAVKQVIAGYEPANLYTKSIGLQSVAINKMIYQSIIHFGENYAAKTGWTDFYDKIKEMNDNEDILSLYIHEKGTNKGTTYHFDKDGKKLINIIVPVELSDH